MLLLLVALLAALAAGKVEVLTDADFAQRTSGGGVWLVEFYASWCGWCKRLEPTWNELAAAVEGRANVHVAKIECIEQPAVCQRLGVRGFPTIKLLEGAHMYPFAGGNRDLESLRAFLHGGYRNVTAEDNPLFNAAPPQLVSTAGAAASGEHPETQLTEQTFLDRVSQGRWLVAAVAPWCGHCQALAPTLATLSRTQGLPFQVGSINCDNNPNLCRELGVQAFPTVFVVENGYRYRHEDGRDRSLDALKRFAETDFALADALPLGVSLAQGRSLPRRGAALVLDDSSFDEMTARDIWLIGFTCDSSECKAMESALSEVQRSYSVHLRVGLVECGAAPVTCREQGVSQAPSVHLLYLDRIFVYQGDHSVAGYTSFVADGFRKAESRSRVHIGMKRRLSFANLWNAAAYEDFFRQHRYVVVGSLAVAILIWGMFLGSALATPPSVVYARVAQAKARAEANKGPEAKKTK